MKRRTLLFLSLVGFAIAAGSASATTVTPSGQSFTARSGSVTIELLSSEGPWIVACNSAQFGGKVPSGYDNPNIKFGVGGSVITQISPPVLSNCILESTFPAEVKTFAPMNWTISWDANTLPTISGGYPIETIAVPQNGMQISTPFLDCIIDMANETPPVALTGDMPFEGAFRFIRQEISMVHTGSSCPPLASIARLTASFTTTPTVAVRRP